MDAPGDPWGTDLKVPFDVVLLMWEHEKLDVYRKATDVAALLDSIAARFPEARYDLRDQLRRASSSIPLNTAEGANEFSPAEKARFYRMARRSSAECAAILDLADRVIGSVNGSEEAKKLLNDVAAMLTRMIKAQPARR